MTSQEQLSLLRAELELKGLTPKVTRVRGQRGPKKSLWGVKSRVSGVNRKGQVAHKVGNMNPNLPTEGKVMTNL